MTIQTKIDAGIVSLLQRDPIANMENKFSKPFEDFSAAQKKILSERSGTYNLAVSDVFRRMNDTYFGISWTQFITLIKSYGFVEGHTYKFEHSDVIDIDKTCHETGAIYYHPIKGLVLWASTWGDGMYLNGGNVYGSLKFPYPIESKPVRGLRGEFILNDVIMTDKIHQATRALNTVSAKYEPVMSWDDGNAIFSIDIRQALINILSIIEIYFVFTNPWYKGQKMLVIDSSEMKKVKDPRKLIDDRIMACPQFMRDMISY